MRVRSLLRALTVEEKTELRQLLPVECRVCPDVGTGRFPHALTKFFGDDAKRLIGIYAELLMQSHATLESLTLILEPDFDIVSPAYAKVMSSKTTAAFLDHLNQTRAAVLGVSQDVSYNHELTDVTGQIIGHPDIVAPTKIFEVKTSTDLKHKWIDFMFQLFTYSCLSEECTNVYLVLPLQQSIVTYCVAEWDRTKFPRCLLQAFNRLQSNHHKLLHGRHLISRYNIGGHRQIEDTLITTLSGFQPDIPYQIFLGSNRTTKYTMPDQTISMCSDLITLHKLLVFVHSPYIINLARPIEYKEGYNLTCLTRQLRYAKAMNTRGVVVHVGAHVKQGVEVGLQHMRTHVLLSLEDASVNTPLLLETPCGEGTELLTTVNAFINFIVQINDPRLGVCVDLCHVFASGMMPSEYLTRLIEAGIVPKLIHANDSAREFGCCVDRHEAIGIGKIGLIELEKCFKIGRRYNIPMLQE